MPKLANIKQIAKDCYDEVAKNEVDWNDKWGEEKPDTFLGGYLYELWRTPAQLVDVEKVEKLPEPQKSQAIENAIANYHYLIWLFPQAIPEDKISKIHAHLIRLFCYRHKITWAYYQSRYLKNKLKANYREIQEYVRDFTHKKENYKELQETLTKTLDILASYAVNLSQLQAQSRTIAVNLENYRDMLEILKGFNKGSVPDCLNKFSDFAERKYQRQIDADYAALSPGMTLLENLIKTVEGIVELNQARSDRALNNTVAIASIGLALSGVTASLISTQLPSPKEPVEKGNPMSLRDAFGWSLVPSLILILAILAGIKFRRN